MQNTAKPIFYLFITIVILPTLVFSLLEIDNLTQYEKVIEDSYKRQLESVLVNVNLYNQGVVEEWRDLMNISMAEDQGINDRIKNMMRENPSILGAFNTNNNGFNYIYNNGNWINPDSIQRVLKENDSIILKMKDYLVDKGYKRIEAIRLNANTSMWVFICKLKGQALETCGFIFNPELFVDDILGPKLQEIGREDINILVFDTLSNKTVYQTDRNETNIESIIAETLWLIPHLKTGINLKSSTISEIVKPRTKKQLTLIITANLILIFGLILLFRNMRKDMALAQLKSEFVSNVSHEIRTPLALIQMYIETLEMDRVKSENKKKEYYGVILNETERLSGIVNKILNFTQIEKGQRRYVFVETDLNQLLEEVLGTYKFHLEKKGFEHSSHFAPDLPKIMADKEAIMESVVNLIENAIKYSSDKKNIIVRSGISYNSVYVEVKDYGIGISAKDQKSIFDQFYRVSSGDLAYKAKGTGLGLTIVKHVMDAHSGKIDVESRKGSGSSFKLMFPII